MRARLTAAFGLLGALLVVALVGFRALTIADLAEDDLRADLDREARLVATVVAAGFARDAQEGDAPTEAELAAYAAPDRLVSVVLPGGGTLEARGPEWTEGPDPLRGAATVDQVVAEVSAPAGAVDDEVARALPSLLALGGVLVLLALLVGYLVADRLSRPFVQLAGAAGALARGRLDLRLPRTRVLEARTLADALRASADRLEESLRRERDLALRASHELRTPLTGLRLELDDLRHRDDVPPDLAGAAEAALARIDGLDRAVEAVVQEARSHPVVAEAQLPLAQVAPDVARRWSDALGLAGTDLEVDLTGDTAVPLTPGPLEQLLDELLVEVLAHRPAGAQLGLEGGAQHLRVTVRLDGAGERREVRPGVAPLDRVRRLVETLGGRVSGDLVGPRGLVVLVPQR